MLDEFSLVTDTLAVVEAAEDSADRDRSRPKPALAPDRILEVGMAFWSSKTLLSAVELGLFSLLGHGPRTGAAIERKLGLHPRATDDFLDALVAIGMLDRDGDGADALY